MFTLFWNLRISLRATVPGLKRWGFLRPEEMGALLRATFWATSCLRGTFWAVDFLAVCLVLAINLIIGLRIVQHLRRAYNSKNRPERLDVVIACKTERFF